MDPGDPFHIIRRFWAANNIAQNPDDPREWECLPADAMSHVLAFLDKRNMASMRLVCRTWHACVNSSVSNLQLCTWPTKPRFLANFTSLAQLTLQGPGIANPCQRSNTLNPLLEALALLPKLQHLSLAHTGPGGVDQLHLLTGLTSLELIRTHASSSSSRRSDGQGGYLPAVVEDDPQQQLHHNPQMLPPAADALDAELDMHEVGWALPGAAEDEQLAAGAAAAVQQHNTLPAGSSSSNADDYALPVSMTRLVHLELLTLESICPDSAILSKLKQLKKLELKGRTCKFRNGLLVAINPLPGIGALSSLTCLISRCNYGISRLPADIRALTALLHLDVSKNMLWGLPAEFTRLANLQHLDVSSNCLAALPEDISELTALTYLDASNNSRVILPTGLTRLSGLIQLNLSWVWSDLNVIWDGSRGLSSLEVLNVVGNGIAELPDSCRGFKALTNLSLSMNNLSTLPDSISCLTSLALLEVSDNRLSELPDALCNLPHLASLGLRSNCLDKLPQDLGAMTAMTFLDASMNHIAALPDSLTSLTALNQLALSMNPLLSLPPGLSALKSLKILEMYYVRLEGEQSATDNGLGRLQQLIPGLYIFSNTVEPYGSGDVTEWGGTAAAAAADRQQQQQPEMLTAPRLDLGVDGVEGSDEDLLLLLSPIASSSDNAVAAADSPGSVFSHVTAASSSNAGSSSSSAIGVAGYGVSGQQVYGIHGLTPDVVSPNAGSSSSSSMAAGTSRQLFGALSASGNAAAAAAATLETAHSGPDILRSQGKDQEYGDATHEDQLLPTASGGSSGSSSRVTFTTDAPLATPALTSSSSSSSNAGQVSWCQRLGATSDHCWAQTSTAAAAAANQSTYLHGAYSCDLSMLAAAAAAADASAAAASSCNATDVVMPLRPLFKAHSMGRPLLSRYSRGGEATGSPTGSSGYGLAARFLGNARSSAADDDNNSAGHATAAAAAASNAGPVIAAAAAADVHADDRAGRRRTMYDDEAD